VKDMIVINAFMLWNLKKMEEILEYSSHVSSLDAQTVGYLKTPLVPVSNSRDKKNNSRTAQLNFFLGVISRGKVDQIWRPPLTFIQYENHYKTVLQQVI